MTMTIRDYILEILKTIETWKHALLDPKAFLSPGFTPSESQLLDGLVFFFWMSGVAMLLLMPFTLSQQGDFGAKLKLTAQALVGVMTAVVMAMAWHFSFALMGGTASFSGTFLGYVWAGGPYVPLSGLCTLLSLAGLPRELRKMAFNPASMQVAMARMREGGTGGGGAGLGGC